jgi:thiosulfate dehydrogenase [quinone] large subunit
MMFSDTRRESRVIDGDLAYLLLRATIGMNILGHGLARVFSGQEQFASALATSFRSTPLAAALVIQFASALPWIEGTIGLLVLIGLFSRLALSAGATLIIILTFGATLHQDWESAGLQLIYAAVYAALLALSNRNAYSADALMRRFSSKGEPQ